MFERFRDLLPERETDDPIGCREPSIPQRLVFEKLVQVLLFGCDYEELADETCLG